MTAVIKRAASVIGGEAAVRAANFAAILFIARAYGKPTLGAYAACLAVVTVVVMFADNGLQTAAITQMRSVDSPRNRTLGQLMVGKTALLSIAVLLLVSIPAISQRDARYWTIGTWVLLRTVLQSYSQMQMSVLKAISLANWIAVIQGLHSCVLLFGIWLCFQNGWGVVALLAWFAAGQTFELLFGSAVLFRHGVWPAWPKHFALLATVKLATPYGIVYGLANLIVRLDTIVLAGLVLPGELGAFSAANAVFVVIYVCAWLFGSVLLPEMVCLSRQPEQLLRYTNRWAGRTSIVTVPCVILFSLLAPRLIAAIYGSTFSSSGILASVMSLAVPLIFLNSIYTTQAIAANDQAIYLTVYGGGVVATLVLDLLLGRMFGALGIATAIVLREAGMLLAFLFFCARLSLAQEHSGFCVTSTSDEMVLAPRPGQESRATHV